MNKAILQSQNRTKQKVLKKKLKRKEQFSVKIKSKKQNRLNKLLPTLN